MRGPVEEHERTIKLDGLRPASAMLQSTEEKGQSISSESMKLFLGAGFTGRENLDLSILGYDVSKVC
jgi:hypothetical protein